MLHIPPASRQPFPRGEAAARNKEGRGGAENPALAGDPPEAGRGGSRAAPGGDLRRGGAGSPAHPGQLRVQGAPRAAFEHETHHQSHPPVGGQAQIATGTLQSQRSSGPSTSFQARHHLHLPFWVDTDLVAGEGGVVGRRGLRRKPRQDPGATTRRPRRARPKNEPRARPNRLAAGLRSWLRSLRLLAGLRGRSGGFGSTHPPTASPPSLSPPVRCASRASFGPSGPAAPRSLGTRLGPAALGGRLGAALGAARPARVALPSGVPLRAVAASPSASGPRAGLRPVRCAPRPAAAARSGLLAPSRRFVRFAPLSGLLLASWPAHLARFWAARDEVSAWSRQDPGVVCGANRASRRLRPRLPSSPC